MASRLQFQSLQQLDFLERAQQQRPPPPLPLLPARRQLAIGVVVAHFETVAAALVDTAAVALAGTQDTAQVDILVGAMAAAQEMVRVAPAAGARDGPAVAVVV